MLPFTLNIVLIAATISTVAVSSAAFAGEDEAPETQLDESDVKAADCSLCEAKFAELEKQKKQLDVESQYLGKNRDFLSMLNAKEASKFLKVKGNMTVILKQMDETKGRIAALENDLRKEGCDRCKPADGAKPSSGEKPDQPSTSPSKASPAPGEKKSG